tara:strand:- start:568 stop:1020 length:453 start_codon:yes stop_codon:yes gene_type:complete
MFKLYIDKKAIDTLIEVLKKNDLTQIEVKDGKKSIKIARESIKVHNIGQGGPESNNLHNQSNASKEVKEKTTIENAIKAPMLGTLYHASSPKAKAFIKEGKKVKIGDILFIIEAMKTMNQVKSDRDGIVKKILVENGMPVEFNQDLVVIE